MRIISGSRRGKKLFAPADDRVRPTEDRVKEALFNILQDVTDLHFLDLFAGSGQVGIEAISRGAAFVTFVDSAADSVALTRRNLALTGFEESAKVVRSDGADYLCRCTETYDVVFLDPPYGAGLLNTVLPLAAECTAPEGVIFCEHPKEAELPEEAGDFKKFKVYKYGKISLTCYKRS